MNWDADSAEIVETKNSVGPGNIVLIELASSSAAEMFCGFGRIGASAESVASEAADAALSYLASGAVAGEHLADWQGFMEGAVDTGEAAAQALTGRIRRRKVA